MTGATVSHYRILEALGAGGMGLVFKAEDLRLGRLVALKFVSQELARNEHALKRFQREAKAASSLNHPNICTIHQIDEFEGNPFIVMELLEGEPLSALVHEAPIELSDLIEIAIQITGALQAAHEKAIIHRDIKPSNIFVTRQRVAKILDFGIAKLTSEPLASTAETVSADLGFASNGSLTQPGLPVGTVGYMAPEQIRGEEIDARADLFSFGATLYEMATGEMPFRGSSSAVVLGAILHGVPAAPSVHNPRLPPQFDRIVAKALQKDKSARYQTAAELQADLLRLKHDLDTGRKTIPKRLLPWGIAAAAVLLCIALITYRLTTSAPNRVARSQSTIHSSRRSLAVLGFQNLTGRRNIEWLSTALSEMLSTELAAGQNLRIVPGENVARAKAGLSLVTFDTYNEHTLTRLKKNLRTDLVVLGSYVDLGTQAGNQLRVDVRLQDTARGETLLAISETGTESNLFQLVSLIGSQLREKLSVGEVPASEMEGVRASLPSNADVMRLYAEGLKALRVFDFLPARDLLRKVVSAQPDYAPGHSALSLAYSALGYDEDARREGKRAYELSAGLSREDRLAIEAHYREATREWDQAIQIYRSLWRSFPDNIEYGLRLAAAQTFAGNGQDALKTVIELRKLPNPSRDDPRIDLAQAAAFNSLGDFEQTLRATESAIAKSGGSHLVLAGAYHSKGWALYRTGRSPEALIALRQAQKLYSAASQKQGTARMLNVIGDIIYTSGDLAKARELYEEALAIYRETGDQAGIAIALNDIANALYTKGDFAKARPLYEESLEINRAVGSKRGVAGALGNLANVLDSEGDLEAAGKAQEEALVAFRQIGDQRGASATLTNIGTLLLEKGDLLGARKAQEQAVADAGKINFKSGVAYALQGLGEALVPQDDLEGARRNFEKAIAIRHDSGEHGALAETWIDLADLSIHEGKFNAAEQMARSAIQELQSDKEFAEEALATAVLARAELAQGKLSEAKLASSRATSVIPQSAAYPYRFLVDIASARVRTATGEGREAEKTVQGVIEIARRYGYLGYEFEGRLALGEIESKSGKRAAGVAVLKDLQRDAGLKGFSLIAREAHDAVSRGR